MKQPSKSPQTQPTPEIDERYMKLPRRKTRGMSSKRSDRQSSDSPPARTRTCMCVWREMEIGYWIGKTRSRGEEKEGKFSNSLPRLAGNGRGEERCASTYCLAPADSRPGESQMLCYARYNGWGRGRAYGRGKQLFCGTDVHMQRVGTVSTVLRFSPTEFRLHQESFFDTGLC